MTPLSHQIDGTLRTQLNTNLNQLETSLTNHINTHKAENKALLVNINGFQHDSLQSRLLELETALQSFGYNLSGGNK